MKTNYFRRRPLPSAIALLLFCVSAHAQTKNDVLKIRQSNNVAKLDSLQIAFGRDYQKMLARASSKNIALTYTDARGVVNTLDHIDANGTPHYIAPAGSWPHADAAAFDIPQIKSTRVDHLHSGGSLGLSLDGQNMTIGMWESGAVHPRVTHNEFDGPGGTDRVAIMDATSPVISGHPTHVMGIMVASGLSATAKGMAPQAFAKAYDSGNATAEMTNEASNNGLLISNHSYGPSESNGPETWGTYNAASYNFDNIMFYAKKYLIVNSAGNSGFTNINSAPLDPSKPQYDKIGGQNVSKNVLVVANVRDAVVDAAGNITSPIVMEPGTSPGPTDDLRIKPDIAGNGDDVNSTWYTADNAYASTGGTSMAAPNVAGSLLLLQQHWHNIYGVFMNSATLKGLALHTADDVTQYGVGPDAYSGWGLLNAKKAAETITANGSKSIVNEFTLAQGQTYTLNVYGDGVNQVMASISWTDKPGTYNANPPVNDTSAKLVNDLDIRITQAENVYYPWKLVAVDANAKGDNTKDPYERVEAPASSGMYTITVTHKGTLYNNSQDYSLIVTGVNMCPFAGGTLSPDQFVCVGYQVAPITLSGHYGSVVKWQKSAYANFAAATDIANTTTTLNGSQVGTLVSTTYVRAVINAGVCGTVYSPVFKATVKTTVWNGTTWSNGVPDINTGVIVTGDLVINSDFSACSISVNSGTVTVNTGSDMTITNTVSVSPSPASLTFEEGANLLQTTDAINTGAIKVKRNASLSRLDCVFWSCPVKNMKIWDFSPATTNGNFYTYNETTSAWTVWSPNQNFTTAKGLIIRAPDNFPTYPTKSTFNGVFSGNPNNGPYSVPVTVNGQGFNLIGNPYPSPLDANAFLATNPGTLYFWAHIDQSGSTANYATYNATGGTASTLGGQTPNGIIQTGQGFLLKTATAGNAVFGNAMRSGNNANQFFRNQAKDRYWLNLFDGRSFAGQMLVGYVEGAKAGYDERFDGSALVSDTSFLGSLIEDHVCAIQGRPLEFEKTDAIPLAFQAFKAGEFQIALDKTESAFDNRDIFLFDRFKGKSQDLKSGAYSFVSEKGRFDDRFEIRYENKTAAESASHPIVTYVKNHDLYFDSAAPMQKIELFDTTGRSIRTVENIHGTTAAIQNLRVTGQLVVARVTLENGEVGIIKTIL